MTMEKEMTLKQKLMDVLAAIDLGDMSETYFGKDGAYLYHKFNGVDDKGNPVEFTADELETLRGALCDLADRLRRAAEMI